MRRLLLLSALLLFAVAACKEDEPAETRSFFDTSQGASGAQQGTLPKGHPPIGGGMGGMAGAPGGDAAPAGTPVLSGTITVGGAVAGKVPQGTLYITARVPAKPGQKGQAVLVKRVAAPTFPYAFELTTSNSMMGGAPVPDALTVEAHVDQDGDAISRTPGDVEGETEAPVKKGAKDVAVVLDTVVTDAKPGMRIDGN